ncbi:MAG TPA: hypothetical protein VIA81_06550 [Acidimicrobiia bacterium]
MDAKTVMYALVGAPVVAARKVGDRFDDIRVSLSKEADTFGKAANKRIATWAGEGKKVVTRISDAKVVDDLAARVDFDQVSTQVSKLRDQLEDMLSTWRASFRPEKLPTIKVEASTEGVRFDAIPAKKAPARKAPARKAASTATAKKTATKTTAKKASARKAPARPAAKRTAAASTA